LAGARRTLRGRCQSQARGAFRAFRQFVFDLAHAEVRGALFKEGADKRACTRWVSMRPRRASSVCQSRRLGSRGPRSHSRSRESPPLWRNYWRELRLNPSGIPAPARGLARVPSPSADNDRVQIVRVGSPLRIDPIVPPIGSFVPFVVPPTWQVTYWSSFKGPCPEVCRETWSQVDGLIGHVGTSSCGALSMPRRSRSWRRCMGLFFFLNSRI